MTQANRAGKALLTVWVDPPIRDAIKILAIKKGVTVTDFITADIESLVSKSKTAP